MLLCGFVVYMVVNVLNMKKNPTELEIADEHHDEPETEEKTSNAGLVKDIVMLVTE